ncbi:MAG: endonuclease/exonuclease/phosphatase family protein [Pseudomonadota bacterium]
MRVLAALCLAIAAFPASPWAQDLAKPADAVRIATFNVSLARGQAGKLISELRAGGAPQVDAVAEIIQRVQPDILLINELDHDPRREALTLFLETLKVSRNGAQPSLFEHSFTAPVNTGVITGRDLDGDGRIRAPEDAHGWGLFEGQFGMALLSAYPIVSTRTFQKTPWSAAPFADPPLTSDGGGYYAPNVWEALRLSSKNHWDVAVALPDGRQLHLLASHPTPPVFDGPEDRNGLRNAAEILFWRDYVDGADWIEDDVGEVGGLQANASFVILGDLNNDPADGDGVSGALWALLDHARVQDPSPISLGGSEAAALQAGVNATHQTDPALDTADWRDETGKGPGNLRVDYVLPSSDLKVLGDGVFWPSLVDPLWRLTGDGKPIISSDHRLVWVDIALEIRPSD